MDQLLVLFEEKVPVIRLVTPATVTFLLPIPHTKEEITPVYIGIDMKRRGGLTPGYIQKICNEASHSLSVTPGFPVTAGSGGIASALLRLGRRFGEDGQHRTFGSDYVQYRLLVYASGEYFLFV